MTVVATAAVAEVAAAAAAVMVAAQLTHKSGANQNA
jgi:hypothetical protein